MPIQSQSIWMNLERFYVSWSQRIRTYLGLTKIQAYLQNISSQVEKNTGLLITIDSTLNLVKEDIVQLKTHIQTQSLTNDTSIEDLNRKLQQIDVKLQKIENRKRFL